MSEIIMCRSCKEQISINAKTCPYCNKPTEKKLKLKKFIADLFDAKKMHNMMDL